MMGRNTRMALICAMIGVLGLAAAPVAAQTVILVRHGEKADEGRDPDLSQAGQARAEALAQGLGGAGLTHVLVTPLRRTYQTAGPSAAGAGLAPLAVGFDGGIEAHVARVAETARGFGPDAVVLVAGHSNTIPLIARALGAVDEAEMSDCEYDRLIVLDLGGETVRAVRARYGAPTEAC